MMKKVLLLVSFCFVLPVFAQELNNKVIKVSKKSKKIETTLKDKGVTVKYVWLADKDEDKDKFKLVDGFKAQKVEPVEIQSIWVEETEKTLNEEQIKALLNNPYCPENSTCSSTYMKIKNKIPAILTLADEDHIDGSMYTTVIFEYYPLGSNKVVYFTDTYHLSASNIDLRGDILGLIEKQGTEYISIK